MQYLQPKYSWLSALICCLFLAASCQNKTIEPYNESNYKEVSRGKYRGTDLYAIILKNELDTQYELVKLFIDSSYDKNFFIQHFKYRGLMEGPMESFTAGKSDGKQFYKQGKRHGQNVILRSDSTIEEKQFYDMGKKVGIWEYYDSKGRLFKKKFYDQNKFIKQEIYNREGKLVRTEFEESRFY
ncbi:MAG TPA: hypothetical protein VFR58_05105 [Flavisolibacter sp.]|nr:hypothetical protein [Flavisolibacter sp.]